MTRTLSEVTALLDAWNAGDSAALEELIPVLYDELHEMASRAFHRESEGHTLQPTALVNEVYLRFKGQRKVQWHSRAEFLGVAATHIRHILVDHARARRAEKRGGGEARIPIEEIHLVEAEAPDYLDLHTALEKLAELAPRQSRIVELRIFGGLEHIEIAQIQGISRATVCRDWQTAQLWLKRELSPE